MSERLLITFYGDDFTGSTDAMESFTLAGARTVLFFKPPDDAMLARFPGARAIGVAGVTRSLAPGAMEAELRPAFARLKALGAPVLQYKVCSTFDSSPAVGSIGCVIDVARTIFQEAAFVPLVVGAPALGRFCVFGNLFATTGTEPQPVRLDRHPSTSTHPVTPADESDLRVHLRRQTNARVALYDVLKYELAEGEQRDALQRTLADHRPDVVLFDVLTDRHLGAIGQLLGGMLPGFAVGSSGFGAVMGKAWLARGEAAPPGRLPDPGPAQPLLVASGSCSPVTARQIDWAIAHGFEHIPLAADAILTRQETERELRRATEAVVAHLAAGRRVIVHTTRGADDPRMTPAGPSTARILGEALGLIVTAAVTRARIRRVLIAGGDTSGYLARTLGIDALEMIAPLTPGAPLCRASAPKGSPFDGLELNFKGGQVGRPDYFAAVARGTLAETNGQ